MRETQITYGIVISNKLILKEGSYIEDISVDDTIILYGILNRIGACELVTYLRMRSGEQSIQTPYLVSTLEVLLTD